MKEIIMLEQDKASESKMPELPDELSDEALDRTTLVVRVDQMMVAARLAKTVASVRGSTHAAAPSRKVMPILANLFEAPALRLR
jgi:hypothetical protein